MRHTQKHHGLGRGSKNLREREGQMSLCLIWQWKGLSQWDLFGVLEIGIGKQQWEILNNLELFGFLGSFRDSGFCASAAKSWHHGTNPDGVLRLQATWAGGRISYLLATAGKYLPESRQVFSDRVRRNKGDKGGGKGKGKDGKGNGKGKFKPQAKRAAAPANP